MRILAIDSSGMPASAAVCEDGILLAEYTVNFKRTHSQTLLPMMDEVKRMLELDLESLDAVAVAGGPGSFTGLRIGSATAKGIGLALNKPIIHVPTLEAMAYNYFGNNSLIVPMLDARRSQVFAGIYTFSRIDERNLSETESQTKAADPLTVIQDQEPADVAELCEKLNEMSEKMNKAVILLGDGAFAYRELIDSCLTVPHIFAPAHLAAQRAGSAAVRGMDLARLGKMETAAEHRPEYLRVSQAERVRAQTNVAAQTEKEGTASRTEKEGTASRTEKEGTASRPEKEGTASRPEKEGTASRPEKECVQSGKESRPI